MASKIFKERFRNKCSFLSRDGKIHISPDRMIEKPLYSQVHTPSTKTLMKLSLNNPSSSLSPTPTNQLCEASFYSLGPSGRSQVLVNERQKLSFANLPFKDRHLTKVKLASHSQDRGLKFKPYTIEDYKLIKSDKYYQLGGLGPVQIGSPGWTNKKEKSERRRKYSSKIFRKKRDTPHSIQQKRDPSFRFLEKFRSADERSTNN